MIRPPQLPLGKGGDNFRQGAVRIVDFLPTIRKDERGLLLVVRSRCSIDKAKATANVSKKKT